MECAEWHHFSFFVLLYAALIYLVLCDGSERF